MTDGIDYPEGDIGEERERLVEVDDEELHDELERIADENAEWRDEYGVESPEELRESIDEEMGVEERERRLEDAYDWEHNQHTRELILAVAYRRNADLAEEANEAWSSVNTDGIDCRDSDNVFADEELHDDEPTGKVRERVRQVLSSLSEPAKVSTIAEMADCSAEGARNSLREYREMGLVVKTNDNPEMYERNPAYFQFLRSHRLGQEHSTDELREQLVEKYREHRAFVDRFDAQSPVEVEVDDPESRERFDAVFEWEALLSEADDLREAYRQQTGTMPTAIEDLPTGEWSEMSAEANRYLAGDEDS